MTKRNGSMEGAGGGRGGVDGYKSRTLECRKLSSIVTESEWRLGIMLGRRDVQRGAL